MFFFKRDKELKITPSFLKSIKNKPVSGDINKNIKAIGEVLKRFNIGVDEMFKPIVSPTVTTYSLRPVSRARITDITHSMNEFRNAISHELQVYPVRVIVSGEDVYTVAIEVPNVRNGVTVSLKSELETEEFKKFKGELVVPLGRDTNNKQWIFDLQSLPHLLIAGATNSGKSNFINSLIISLMTRHTPDTLKFILADAKRVELPRYNGLPHLLRPVLVDGKEVIDALYWCCEEMERRYNILYESGCKNIKEYNEKHKETMAYIVFIMDEMSDFIYTDGKRFEGGVIRLAQMSRVIGIHLIMATSRPSFEIYTGLMKTNIPARLAFCTASKDDSKCILEYSGAENLVGQGDALFHPTELLKPVRLQTPYVSDEDIERVADYLKEKPSLKN